MATRKTASKTPKTAPKAAPKQDSAVEALEKRVAELEKKLSEAPAAEPTSVDAAARAEITRLNTLLKSVCEALAESPSVFAIQKKLSRPLR